MMKIKTTTLIWLMLPVVSAGSASGTDVLRSARALDDFLRSGRLEERDFALKGQVRHPCNPFRKNFFLDDGTNIVRLVDNALWPRTFLRDGDIVEVTGRTAILRNCSVNPDCLTIVKTGHRPLPAPPERTIAELRNDRGRPYMAARVKGVVRDVIVDDIDREFSNIVLTENGSSLYISVKCRDVFWPKLKALIGAEVSVDGIIRTDEKFIAAHGFHRHGNRSIQEPTLTVAGHEAFRILRPAPEDPFAAPFLDRLSPIWPEDLLTETRRRVDGVVLSTAKTRGFFLVTDDGQLVTVDLSEDAVPKFGESVSVVGMPVTDFYRINLIRAVWRPNGQPVPVRNDTPERLTIENLITDGGGRTQYQVNRFGKRLTISGSVRSLPPAGSDDRKITLERNGHLLFVVAEPGISPFDDVVIGAEIEATGICLMDIDSWRPGMTFPRVTGVRLAVQSPDDVIVLSRPSWWTTRRLAALLVVIALAALAVVIWNLTLRTLVVRRSRELLREQARRLAETLRVEERTRLAAELHDTVAQDLSALSLQLDAAGRLADSDPGTMKSILGFCSRSLLACRRGLRDCLWDLRSQALDEKDMNAAIRRALAPHIRNAALVTRFNVPRRKLNDNTAHAVLRILGELASNAVRHGRAKTIRIAGAIDDGELGFSCTDDGCGFDVGSAPGPVEGHFGLQGIRDRVRTLGGDFELSSIPGKGTRACVRLRFSTDKMPI